jgi:hypothetical protein
MPIPGFHLTSSQLVVGWRKRRLEILKSLPAKLLAEYRELGRLIRGVQAAELENARRRNEAQVGIDTSMPLIALDPKAKATIGFFPPSPRVPLSVHKKKLIDFLTAHGPSMRGEIAAKTGIPPGSLSELLGGNEFEQPRRGFWALKGQAKKAAPAAQQRPAPGTRLIATSKD